jgi:hypothetical protein
VLSRATAVPAAIAEIDPTQRGRHYQLIAEHGGRAGKRKANPILGRESQL